VIDPSYLWGIGPAALHEIEAAVRDFRASGKPVIAVGDTMGQQQYYLAALADEVWLNPEGLVWLDGYSVFRQYYREVLDKLYVEVTLFRAGEYKSAGEPYIRNDMSPQARASNLAWLTSLWQQYLEGVSRLRGVPLENLTDAIESFPDLLEQAGGDFAELAMDLGLVDRLASRSEAYQELATLSAPGHNGEGFRQVGVNDYLVATSLQGVNPQTQKVAVLVAQGEIVPGYAERGYIASESFIERLRALSRRQDVPAVVLRIDSPGGDAFASEKIRAETQALREAGKTVVVSMGNVAASGGYWMAMAADEVWASPSTLTGSIGVYGLAPRLHESLAQVGVHTDGVGTTTLSGQFDLTRPMEPEIERIYRASVAKIYEDFISIVSEARNRPPEDIMEVAGGRVWSGAQALDAGLVDRTGTLQEAIESAGRIAGLGTDFSVEYEESELSTLELFLLEFAGDVAARSELFSAWNPPLARQIFGGFQSDLAFLGRTAGRLTVMAHCWCRIE
jgi:protease-4